MLGLALGFTLGSWLGVDGGEGDRLWSVAKVMVRVRFRVSVE